MRVLTTQPRSRHSVANQEPERQSGWAPQLRWDEKGVVPMTFLTEVRLEMRRERGGLVGERL